MPSSCVLALSVLLTVLLSSGRVIAQPDTLYVSVDIANIHQVDLTTATFWIDINLRMRFPNGTAFMGEPRLANRAGSPNWGQAHLPSAGLRRYTAQMNFIPNLRKFPFDSQTLEFSFSHPSLNASYLKWQPLTEECFLSSLLRLRGWKYSNASLAVITRPETYSALGQTFDQVQVSIYIERTLTGGIQTLLSPSFTMIMVFVSFWLPIKESITRISMATAALISEVFIHVALRNSSLLNLNSLVIMDGFMILSYGLILLAILTNVIITVLLRGSDKSKMLARRIGSRVRYVVWFFGPGAYMFLFFDKKWLWVPFLFIIFPSILAIAIGKLCKKYRFEHAKNQKPKTHPLENSEELDDFDTDSEDWDDEDRAPAPMEDAFEGNTRDTAIKREIRRGGGDIPARTSISSSDEHS